MMTPTNTWMRTLSGAAMLMLLAVVAITSSGCDTTVNDTDMPQQPFDATGTLSGRVIDRVTSEPISGATIRVDVADTLTATTGSGGAFTVSGLPATRSEDGSTMSGTYNVHVTTPDGSPYRAFYTAEVDLVFGGSGEGSMGSGPGNNLSASVTFPLSKLNGSVSGSLFTESEYTGDELPLAGEAVVLYQDLELRYTADGSPVDSDRVRVASTTTNADGSFSFNRVEEAAQYEIEVVFPEQPGQIIATGALDPGENTTRTLNPVDVTTGVPDFKATLVSPKREDDLDTTDPDFVIAFNRPVALNAYTTPDDPLTTTGPANITNDVFIDGTGAEAPTSKARRTDNEIAVSVSFNRVRDTLTIEPVDPLQDGTEYQLEVPGLFNGTLGFVDEYGRALDSFPGGTDINFSVGVNTDAPDAPNVTVTSITPEEREYDALSITANLEFTPGENAVPIREYEIYRRTADTDDEVGVGPDDFELVGTVDASSTQFGVVTASDVASSQPLFGDDGADYEPVAWYFRAISINGVAGASSAVVEVGDNLGVGLLDADYIDQDGDATVDGVRIGLDEPVPGLSVGDDGAAFLTISGGDAPAVGNISDISSNRRFFIIDITGGTPDASDQATISGLNDYAGNGVDGSEDTVTFN
jgi:hypothetical protein